MPEQQAELRMLFCAALECKTPAERADYIDNACREGPNCADASRRCCRLRWRPRLPGGGDSKRRRAVWNRFSKVPVLCSVRTSCWRRIGEGGFGVVFMAEQRQPVRRKVALKIIKPGMDTPAGDRPLRGRAAGAGADGPSQHRQGARCRRPPASGRPYFVMELVKGVPITEYCDEHQLHAPRAAGAVRARLPGGAARPSEGHHPPRHQAVERAGRRCTTASRCRR